MTHKNIMQLDDFISQALIQIIKGVENAQNEVKDTGAIINPVGLFVTKDNRGKTIESSFKYSIQNIEFDIIVTAQEQDKSKAGLGVFFGEVGIGVQGQVDDTNTQTNKIKFSVPLCLPSTLDTKIQNTPNSKSFEHPLKGVKGIQD